MANDGRIYFSPSEQMKAYLDELTRMGIYGKQRGDVINFILGKEIMRLIEGGTTLTRLPPEREVASDAEEG